MSRLDDLIAQYCPNGVEYKCFGEIASIVRGASPRPINKFITADPNGINWIRIGDVKPGSKYITETTERITLEGAKKSRLVKEGDFILSNSMSFGRPYILKTTGCIHDGWLSISDYSSFYIADFLFYLLSSSIIQEDLEKKASFGGAVQNLNSDIVKGLILPVPPLPVQQEIVRILDSFTQLTTELKTKLQEELQARKKQFEYYLDKIFCFDSNTPIVQLGDAILSLNTGLNPRQFFKLNTDDATNYYITIREIVNGKIVPNEKTDRLNDDAVKLCNNRSNLEAGDVLFSGTGTIGETAVIDETPSNWNIKEGIYSVKPNQNMLNSHFLRYLLMSQKMKETYMKKVAGGTVKSIPMKDMKTLQIPLPPLDEQKRIVKLVERFDKLCNDMSMGLPAEIEARQKQYEYYRDKLLTFKEKRL